MVNTLSLTDIKAELTRARKDYHAAKNDHGNRLKFMENFKEKDRKRLQAAEAARAKARVVKIALNKLESTSVAKILVDDQWKDTQTELEEALFPINKGKINASQHTPFLQPHQRRALGNQGYEAAVDEILEGSFAIPGGTDKYTRMLLRQAKQTQALPPTQSYITTARKRIHRNGKRRRNERQPAYLVYTLECSRLKRRGSTFQPWTHRFKVLHTPPASLIGGGNLALMCNS